MKKQYIVVAIIAGTLGMFGLVAGLHSNPEENTKVQEFHSDWTASSTETPTADNVSGEYDAQVHQLKERLRSNPADTTHLLRLARLYQDGHKPLMAATYYERLLKVKPEDRQSWLDLTNCYASYGDWDKAHVAIQKMLQQFPKDEQGRYNMGAILANLGHPDQAKEIWMQLKDAKNEEVANIAKQSLAMLDQPSMTVKDEQ